MLFRWIGADEHPPIATRVVKLADVVAELRRNR